MNLISGIGMFCVVCGLALKYRPRERDSLMICGIGLFMGLLSLLMSDGLLLLQGVEHGMQVAVLGCCFFQLRRESRVRRARARARAEARLRMRRMHASQKKAEKKACA